MDVAGLMQSYLSYKSDCGEREKMLAKEKLNNLKINPYVCDEIRELVKYSALKTRHFADFKLVLIEMKLFEIAKKRGIGEAINSMSMFTTIVD